MAFLPNYSGLPDAVSLSDTLNHFAAFVTLYLLFERAHHELTCKLRAALLALYAVLIEIVQHFLPTRSAELADVAVDLSAIALSYLALRLIRS
ncbi:MAG: VanZ family protein [Campylobacterales bacterium]|nr:VanZ family protein [Campylobacterales bacterium]